MPRLVAHSLTPGEFSALRTEGPNLGVVKSPLLVATGGRGPANVLQAEGRKAKWSKMLRRWDV